MMPRPPRTTRTDTLCPSSTLFRSASWSSSSIVAPSSATSTAASTSDRPLMALKLDYMVRETGTNLFRNLSLTVASILTVAVSLSLVGGSVLLRYSVDNATQQWQGGIALIVFMQPEASEAQTDAVERQLEESTQIERYEY